MDMIIAIGALMILALGLCALVAALVFQQTQHNQQVEQLLEQIGDLTEKVMAKNYAEFAQGQKMMQPKAKPKGPTMDEMAADAEYINKLNGLIQPVHV